MPRLLLAACAVLALSLIGVLLPRANDRLDARTLKPVTVHSVPWPAWAHSAPRAVAAAPPSSRQQSAALATPLSLEKQLSSEQMSLTDGFVAVAAPVWLERPLFFDRDGQRVRA